MDAAKNLKYASRELKIPLAVLQRWKKVGCPPLLKPPPYNLKEVENWGRLHEPNAFQDSSVPIMSTPKEKTTLPTDPDTRLREFTKLDLEVQILELQCDELRVKWYRKPTTVASLIASIIPAGIAIGTLIWAWKTGVINRQVEIGDIKNREMILSQEKLIVNLERKEQNLTQSIVRLAEGEARLSEHNRAISQISQFTGAYFDRRESSLTLRFNTIGQFNVVERNRLPVIF